MESKGQMLHFAEVCQEGSSSVRLCTTGLPLPTKRCRWWWSLIFWSFDLWSWWEKIILGLTKSTKLDWSHVQLDNSSHCNSNVTPTRTSILWLTHQMSCKKETRLTYNCADLRLTKESLTIEYFEKAILLDFLGENWLGESCLGEKKFWVKGFFGWKFFGWKCF